ncbi:MAG: FHA domain-containing protein, partial [Planctomycetaceae bacterium]
MAAMLLPKDGGAQILIDKPILLVGRGEDCDLCLSSYVKVSRRHCCVVHAEDRFLVRDLGSMNGVRVNGSRVLEQQLEEGDELAIADAVFVFSNGISSRPSSQRS